jgi:hypothetical protein
MEKEEIDIILKASDDFCKDWWQNQTDGYFPDIVDKIDISEGDIQYFHTQFKRMISKLLKKKKQKPLGAGLKTWKKKKEENKLRKK